MENVTENVVETRRQIDLLAIDFNDLNKPVVVSDGWLESWSFCSLLEFVTLEVNNLEDRDPEVDYSEAFEVFAWRTGDEDICGLCGCGIDMVEEK